MLKKSLYAITAIDIDQIIMDKVPESHYLDYKQSLPDKHFKSIFDFLADVVAFANASGGDIVFGIEEEVIDGKHTGIPKGYVNLNTTNFDEAVRRLESLIRNGGIEPTMPIQTKLIDGLPEGPVLIVRVPPSPMAPHMVTKYTKDELRPQFYRRHNGGNHPMDIDEIRVAFRTSEGRYDRLRKFREDRVRLITSETGSSPKLGISAAKVSAHLLPATAFDIASPAPIDRMPDILRANNHNSSEWSSSFNFDGFRAYKRSWEHHIYEYLDVFRNGAIESVWKFDDSYISNIFEVTTIKRITTLVGILSELDVPLPLFIALSLINVKDFPIIPPSHYSGSHSPTKIDRDVLQMPECFLGDVDALMQNTLKPAFDAMYQAGGYPRSMNYDSEGKWIGIGL